ncbi:MAG TPA: L-seryl-tRNA(Sec) selenium transferase, partial [Candidatus Methylomirabilis sp.]
MPNPIPPDMGAILRQIPSVDELLATARILGLLTAQPRWAVLEAIREVLAECRRRALAGDLTPEAARALVAPAALDVAIEVEAVRKARPSLRAVINASGVVLHTNLGRAPLAEAALAAIEAAARGYSTLEFDLTTGARGSRQVHVEDLLCALTGAE